MSNKKNNSENVENYDVVIKTDPELAKRKAAKLSKMDTQPIQAGGFTWEEIAFLVVLGLVFIGSIFIPTKILDEYQVSFLLFVALPLLAWFARLIALDIKQHGK